MKNYLMNTIKASIILAVLFISGQSLYSQSAVYFCTQSGAYSYCYAMNDAVACAEAKCYEYGGSSPILVAFTNTKGNGVIVEGKNSDGKRVIGVALGYSDYGAAFDKAVLECYYAGSVTIPVQVAQWNDGSETNIF
jgi:hypothetical protein